MVGSVDGFGRAILRVRVKNPNSGELSELDAWIDTGFTGELVLSQQQVNALGLALGKAITAGLADGSEVQLDAFTCDVEWFGEWKRIQVIANQGQFPLLGVGLLLDRELHINYRNKALSLV
jgi:clan AA aspartic protease